MTQAPLEDDPALEGFALLRPAGRRVLVRRGYEDAVRSLGLDELPDSEVSVHGGRAAHPVVTLPGGERIVVRGYRRGGMMRHFNRQRYFLGHRAMAELRATERARRGGVRVPEVVAAIERPGAVGYTAALATRLIANATELSRYTFRDPLDELAVLHEAGAQVARMHESGVAHPDLNLHNLLIVAGANDPMVYLLDFDGALVLDDPVPARRRRRDLRRLGRSARKLRAPIGPAGWRAFRDGYGSAWPLTEDLG